MRYIVGFFACIGLISLLTVAGLGFGTYWILSTVDEPEELADSLILKMRIDGGFAEVADRSPIGGLVPGRRSPSLFDVVMTLDRASTDTRVKGIVVDLSGAALDTAEAQELRSAIEGLRASGRFAYAFADTFEHRRGSTAYYTATAFEHIQIQPSGLLGLRGLAM